MLPDHAAQMAAHRRRDQLRSEARWRSGSETRGPPLSVHRSANAPVVPFSSSQTTSTRPAGTDGAPWRVALVANSCSTIERGWTASRPAAPEGRGMPRARKRGRDRVPSRRRHAARHRSSPLWRGGNGRGRGRRCALRRLGEGARVLGAGQPDQRERHRERVLGPVIHLPREHRLALLGPLARRDVVGDRQMREGPSASLRGVAWVSMLRRVPRRPASSSFQRSASPRQTRSWFPCHAARCSGAIRSKTGLPSACDGRSASIMRKPASFICSRVPSGATSLMHSGAVSKTARSRASLPARAASAARRSESPPARSRRRSAFPSRRASASGRE